MAQHAGLATTLANNVRKTETKKWGVQISEKHGIANAQHLAKKNWASYLDTCTYFVRKLVVNSIRITHEFRLDTV